MQVPAMQFTRFYSMTSLETTSSSPLLFRLAGVRQQLRGPQGRIEFELSVSQIEIRAGDKIGVLAKSGTGKSTLVDLLAFAAMPTEVGCFEFHTPDSGGIDVWAMWRRGRDHCA